MYIYNLGKKFAQIVELNRQKTAIIADDRSKINYDDLDKLSNRMTRWLKKQKVGKGDVIAIFNSKHIASFALMIAALKLGVIYVNLDNSSPEERLRKIVHRCDPLHLFYDSNDLEEKATKLHTNTTNLMSGAFQEELQSLSEYPLSQDINNVCADNPAYIMFTSGSTGFPKGVLITHQNVLNFVHWTKATYDIEPEDVFTNVNPMYFDNSVFDFYASIFNGATMAAFSAGTVSDPQKIVKKVEHVKATIWFSVPTMLVFLITMKNLNADVFKSLRIISFGGEGFPKPKLKLLFDLFSHRIRILNVYGPTECTCICSAYDVTEKDFENMHTLAPLGYLAQNFDYLIVDDDGKTSKNGELYLAGPQLGLGYYNDSQRTKESFVEDKSYGNYKRLFYKTGDMVKEDESGVLHILGRSDNQIKHLGYRIEIEEVEAGFSALTYVSEVGVVYEKFENGLGQIVAYLKVDPIKKIDQIKDDIEKILPPYMIPRKIILLNEIPKNSNGKIDRRALINAISN